MRLDGPAGGGTHVICSLELSLENLPPCPCGHVETFVHKRLEFGQSSEAIGPPGTRRLSSSDPSSPIKESFIRMPASSPVQSKTPPMPNCSCAYYDRRIEQVLEKSWDLIISDYYMPRFLGTDALRFPEAQGRRSRMAKGMSLEIAKDTDCS